MASHGRNNQDPRGLNDAATESSVVPASGNNLKAVVKLLARHAANSHFAKAAAKEPDAPAAHYPISSLMPPANRSKA